MTGETGEGVAVNAVVPVMDNEAIQVPGNKVPC